MVAAADPLVAIGVLALWLVTQWSYQYAISDATLTQVWAFAVIAGAAILQLVNPNLTSIHEFYRERIASAFAVGRDASGTVAGQLPPAKEYKLSALKEPPELVVCTTANVNDQKVVPTRRFGVPLTLSPHEVRLEAGDVPTDVGYQETTEVEQDPRWRDLSVMGAVAMSGAAVSPLMGRMGGKVAPFRLLLTLFNVRLGVWVMNPRWPLLQTPSPALAPMATNPRFHQLFSEAFGSTMVNDRWLYLTDGGHLDNLGMVEAVRRAPRQLLVLSASNDPDGTWQDVGAAVSVIRADLGIDLVVTARDYQDGWLRLNVKRLPGAGAEPDGDAAPAVVDDLDVLVVRAVLTKPEWLADGGILQAVTHADGVLGQVQDDVEGQVRLDFEHPMPVDVRAFATRDKTFPARRRAAGLRRPGVRVLPADRPAPGRPGAARQPLVPHSRNRSVGQAEVPAGPEMQRPLPSSCPPTPVGQRGSAGDAHTTR